MAGSVAVSSFARDVNASIRKVPAWPVYVIGALPAALILWQAFTGGLGVDPVKGLEHSVGQWGLKFLVASLCVTPLKRLTGISLLKFRRALGLLAFFYVVLHLATWLVLDIQLRWGDIWADIVKRPYITVGMVGFVALVPLAVTSNTYMMRRMGPVGWRRLHQLAYLAALAGAVHFLMLVKAWPIEPIAYVAGVVVLLAARVWWQRGRWAS